MRTLVWMWLLTFGIGCGTTLSPTAKQRALERTHFTPYTGEQQNWPVATSYRAKIATTRCRIPIYTSLPPRPYEVVGTAESSQRQVARKIAEAAIAAGADAVLVHDDPAFAAANLPMSLVLSGRHGKKVEAIQGVLIRWK